MKLKVGSYLLLVAVGFLLCLFIIEPKTVKETKILKGDAITTIDTIYVKSSPKIKIKEVVVKIPYKTTKIDTVYVTSRNYYKDTIEVEKDFKITYSASTTGTLDSLTLGYVDSRAKIIVREATTTTIVKESKGLYIGGTSDIALNSSVGVLLMKEKNIIGASVKLNQVNFSSPTKYNVSYYRKLF
jgi:hypothetical protein